jgi:hypothetical protein
MYRRFHPTGLTSTQLQRSSRLLDVEIGSLYDCFSDDPSLYFANAD